MMALGFTTLYSMRVPAINYDDRDPMYMNAKRELHKVSYGDINKAQRNMVNSNRKLCPPNHQQPAESHSCYRCTSRIFLDVFCVTPRRVRITFCIMKSALPPPSPLTIVRGCCPQHYSGCNLQQQKVLWWLSIQAFRRT